MKKFFLYIEQFWCGRDRQPSIRRILAVIFSIDLLRNLDRTITSIPKAMRLLFQQKTPDAAVLTAIGGFISNVGMIIATEAALIAALLSLTTYANYRYDKENPGAGGGGGGCATTNVPGKGVAGLPE